MHQLVRSTLLAAGAALAVCHSAHAATGIRISEWMYNGDEFIELTNFGPAAVDFTGWSFDDDSRTPGLVSLSLLGTVNPGEAVIIAESAADTFRANWNLPASVKVLGGNSANLGRNDEINIFDASNSLVDRLTYGDQNFPGTIRTLDISGRPSTLAALGANDVRQWTLSSVADGAGSYQSATGAFVANPGIAPVPEPGTYALLLAGLGLLAGAVHRARASA
jgi:predicted extracellular nuclease